MSPLEQQIAIAESNGYAWKSSDTAESGYTSWQDYINRCGEEVLRDAGVPDYLNDLNAMHEIENNLNGDLDLKYVNNLAELVRPEWQDSDDMFYKSSLWTYNLITATSSERAEAYLRTIGKWKD